MMGPWRVAQVVMWWSSPSPYLDGLLPGIGGTPVAGVEVGPAGISFLVDVGHPVPTGPGTVELLDVQVLVIAAEVGDAPGHPVVVAEVRKAGHPGYGQADDVPLGAGHMALVIDVGGVQGAVGVAGQQGLAGSGAVAGQGPAVAAAVRLVQQVDAPPPRPSVPPGSSPVHPRSGCPGAGFEAGRAGSPGPAGMPVPVPVPAPNCARQVLDSKTAHEDVAHLEYHQAVPRLPGFGFNAGYGVFHGEGAFSGGRFNPGVDTGGVGIHQLCGYVR